MSDSKLRIRNDCISMELEVAQFENKIREPIKMVWTLCSRDLHMYQLGEVIEL